MARSWKQVALDLPWSEGKSGNSVLLCHNIKLVLFLVNFGSDFQPRERIASRGALRHSVPFSGAGKPSASVPVNCTQLLGSSTVRNRAVPPECEGDGTCLRVGSEIVKVSVVFKDGLPNFLRGVKWQQGRTPWAHRATFPQITHPLRQGSWRRSVVAPSGKHCAAPWEMRTFRAERARANIE